MNKKKYMVLTVVSVIAFILITVGVTYSFFSYIGMGSTENTVESGSIKFIYEEINKMGNGIKIEDAFPIDDSEGKTSSNYFDFKVTSTTAQTVAIPYEITARIVEGSDDLSDYVKVYLTKVNGTSEQEKTLSIYSDLPDSTNTLASRHNDKTLYTDEIPAGARDYTENYRLRMWLNNDTNDGSVLDYSPVYTCSDNQYTTEADCRANNGVWNPIESYDNQGKTFAIKINIYANGEQASQQKIESATTTEINGLKINNVAATESTNPTDNFDYYVETTLEESNNIELIPLNDGQTYTVENITEQEANSIKGVAVKNNLNLVKGINYLKVTVTAANKSNTKVYIVKVDARSSIARINIPNQQLSNQITITIKYHNDVSGMYKVGTNGTWTEYTGPITIKAEEVYTLANDDQTITVYAKALNENNQEEETSAIISSLDFDMPNAPVITATSDYPTINVLGITYAGSLSVTYDTRNDVTNYICTKECNNSENWKLYVGNEIIESSEVQAKSVKNDTGLTALTVQSVTIPTNSIGIAAYDNDDETAFNVLYGSSAAMLRYINVDSSAIGKILTFNTDGMSSTLYVRAYNASGTKIDEVTYQNQTTSNYTIPASTTKISLHTGGKTHKLYEMFVNTAPTFVGTYNYPLITGNGIEKAYNNVTINYYSTAVERLYQIVSSDNDFSEDRWVSYTGPVKVDCEDTLYTKSIDADGNVLRQGTYYSDYNKNTITLGAYDGDMGTWFDVLYGSSSGYLRYIKVDSSAIGKTLKLTTDGVSTTLYIRAYDASGATLSTSTYTTAEINYTIPASTDKISLHTGRLTHKLYEMEVND